MQKLLINLINFYQTFLSFDKGVLAIFAPGGACKQNISCSEYTKQSVRKFGASRGILMGMKRIWSCR
ncbi:MAG: membrane protein insertion efficiency factor YidD [Candidatus Daviesbacteria bacterium]|nr:membrane protein insertion efficiency factor YidD [Candidatus Daviesbacteria bacterium]